MWLKRSTPQNIVIGGAAGALPPIVGYAAASGGVTLDSLLLFAHHFHVDAAAFLGARAGQGRDYERVGVPMMPNVKGPARTRLEILLYSLVLAPLGVVPWFTGMGGALYGVAAAIARRRGLLVPAARVYSIRDGAAGEQARDGAVRLFDPLSVRAVRPCSSWSMASASSRGGGYEGMTMAENPAPPALTPAQLRNRRLRNIAIGLAVAFLAALFYAITIVKIGPNVLQPVP